MTMTFKTDSLFCLQLIFTVQAKNCSLFAHFSQLPILRYHNVSANYGTLLLDIAVAIKVRTNLMAEMTKYQ